MHLKVAAIQLYGEFVCIAPVNHYPVRRNIVKPDTEIDGKVSRS